MCAIVPSDEQHPILRNWDLVGMKCTNEISTVRLGTSIKVNRVSSDFMLTKDF